MMWKAGNSQDGEEKPFTLKKSALYSQNKWKNKVRKEITAST